MDFEDWKEEAANYIESAGISYHSGLDDHLFKLWQAGIEHHQVPDLLPPPL